MALSEKHLQDYEFYLDPPQVPLGWEIVALDDIAFVITDGTHKTPQYVNQGVRFISIKNIRPYKPVNWYSYEKYISREEHEELIKRCHPEREDILFPRIGTLGFAKRIDFDEEISIFVGLGLVKPVKQYVLPKYVEYYLNTPYIDRLSIKKANGTGRKTLPLEQSRAFPFPLPPLNEQRRIVAKIEELFSELDKGIESLQTTREQLKVYRQAVLKAACEGQLVPQDPADEPASALLHRILAERRAKWEHEELAKLAAKGKAPLGDRWKQSYEEPSGPDTKELSELPESWVWASLDQAFILERGRFSVRPRNDPRYYDGPYPFVQIGDLPREGGKIQSFTQTLNEEGLSVSKMFAEGTVLIAIVGATIANTGTLTFKACCPDSLVAIQSTNETLLKFAEFYLRSRKHEIRQAAYASGGQPNINLGTLQPYPFPLPPLAEQHRIVEEVERRLSIVADAEQTIEESLVQAAALRQSILKRAFSGQLVPQDPGDEPASVLLERIRAEKAAQEAGRKSRGKPPYQQLSF